MKWSKKLVTLALSCSMAVSSWSVAAVPAVLASDNANAANPAQAPAPQQSITLTREEILSSGAILKTYEWKGVRSGQQARSIARVVEVDLHNPNIKLDVMTGEGNQFTKKNTVHGMVTETGAIAGVNGDFYNTMAEGVPIGPQISDGKLMATPPYLPGFYTFALTKDRKPVIDLFTFKGQVKAKHGPTFPLGGINKTYYWYEPGGQHSMIDGLYMYTSAWGQVDRSNDGVTNPTEVLVRNGIVQQKFDGGIVNMIAPEDGYILRSHGKAAEFVMKHLQVGEPVTLEYEIVPLDPTKTGAFDWRSIQMMIGGHTIMVEDGKPAAWSREVRSLEGFRARTAIGFSKDSRYVYLITIERRDDSEGMTMSELQQFMIGVGVWRGMNLDGGGSTQLVARPLGELAPKLINRTEFGGERLVVNGIGVYSTAPASPLKGFVVEGAKQLFIGEKTELSAKAYDQYFNPVDMAKLRVSWTKPQDEIGSLQGSVFTAAKPGVTKVTISGTETSAGAAAATVRQDTELVVIGRAQIKGLEITSNSTAFFEGGQYQLTASATLANGTRRVIPNGSVQWELLGMKGKVSNTGVLMIESFVKGSVGRVVARYDGFPGMLAISQGVERLVADFESSPFLIAFEGYPEQTGGSVALVRNYKQSDPAGRNTSLQIAYDFSKGTGVKAAYADFAGDGIPVEGEPSAIKLRVYGDGSNHRLRAEFLDPKGKEQRIDLVQRMDWTGWRTITVPLAGLGVTFPTRLHQLYVVNNAEGQSQRPAKGDIALDDVMFLYTGGGPTGNDSGMEKPAVKLTIDQTELTVNGKPVAMDQAPVIVNDLTFVPVKFVTDALGGSVYWSPEDRRVTVVRGGSLIEMNVDGLTLRVNGAGVALDTAPFIMGGRTMVPLRMLSEQLGWKVGWEGATRTVTIQ